MSLKITLSALVALCAVSSSANADPVRGKNLKTLINGKRIYLAVPLGGEFPLYYKKGGKVDGSGEATGLGRTMKPNDSGRWWISDAKLCQKWQTWYDGKVFCFTIEKTSDTKIAWVRDDGYSGTARIGN
jgi:hypothetical protein